MECIRVGGRGAENGPRFCMGSEGGDTATRGFLNTGEPKLKPSNQFKKKKVFGDFQEN